MSRELRRDGCVLLRPESAGVPEDFEVSPDVLDGTVDRLSLFKYCIHGTRLQYTGRDVLSK